MWHFAWCHELCWKNLHTQEVFTKTRTFPRKHQWQYQERRFWNVPKVKKAFGDEMEILYRMSENESLIIMNPSWNCGKNVWNKKWTRKQRQGWWVARAKWNLSIYLSNQTGRKTNPPRRQKKPNYSILQIVIGYGGPESNAYHPETVHDYFKPICF